jgi:hypothetical protein
MNAKIPSFGHLGVSARLSRGRGAQFTITESTDGVRLQVSFGDETARIYLWQIVIEAR